MAHKIDIHSAQTTILRELLFHPQAKFADMQKATGLESDHFKFHIAKLIELGYVDKTERGTYRLSIQGKEHANKLDTDTNTIERQPKISVLIIAWRIREGSDEAEYLVQQRLKNPYFGYWGRLGGKITWGETVLEAAARELKEETGLTAQLEFKGLYHKMDYRVDNDEMLEDKFFLLVAATGPFEGKLMVDFEGGKNAWLTDSEIDAQDKVFQGMRESYGFVSQSHVTFNEEKLTYDPKDY